MSDDNSNERNPFPHAELYFYVIGTVIAAPLAKSGWDGLMVGDSMRGCLALAAAIAAAAGAFSFRYWESHLQEPTRRFIRELVSNKAIVSALALIFFAYVAVVFPDVIERLKPNPIITTGAPKVIAAPPAPTTPRIATAPADVPKKLATIDELRQILSGDMATWINKGQQLTTGAWWNWAVGGETAQLRKEVQTFWERGRELNEKLEHLQKDNVQFPDIHALASSPLGTPFLLKMERFVTPVLALPDDPVKVMGNNLYRTVFEPYAKEAYETINEVENWRRITDRNALQLRQQISQ